MKKRLRRCSAIVSWKTGDEAVEVTERYQGFSLADIREPFVDNVLPNTIASVFFLSGRFKAIKGHDDWPAVGSQYRAETDAQLSFAGAG